LALYDFRGKIFAQTGYMQAAISSGYFWGYPLMTSLAHSIIYLFGGKNPNFLYTLFYLSLIIIFYSLLRLRVSRKAGLFYTLLLAIAPEVFDHSLFSYTNLPYTTYLGLGLIMLINWMVKKGRVGQFVIAALLIALSTWVRSKETFWIIPLLLTFIYCFSRKRYLYILIYSAIFFPIQQTWKIFQSWGVGSRYETLKEITNYLGLLKQFNVSRWIEILKYVYANVIVFLGPVFALFIFAFILSVVTKKFKRDYLYFSTTFLILAFIFVGTYILSYTYTGWEQIGRSASRVSMVLFPLLIYSAGITLVESNGNRKTTKKV
jgi:hypothetical protein